jgi:hypothetical protein
MRLLFVADEIREMLLLRIRCSVRMLVVGVVAFFGVVFGSIRSLLSLRDIGE